MNFKLPQFKSNLLHAIANLTIEFKYFLEKMVNTDQHKAAILYYWLRSYKNYLKQEETFSPKYFPQLKAGQIVKVDFGFGIGSEFGGLHYAIVLVDSNYKNNVVIVCPLRSLKPYKESPDSLYPTDVYLENYLFNILDDKVTKLLESTKKALNQTINDIQSAPQDLIKEDEINTLKRKMAQLEKEIDRINQLITEISRLSTGSIAITSQIRTISKMRILNPTSSESILYNIKLPKSLTNKIKTTIKVLYKL